MGGKRCTLKILEYCNDFDMFQDIVIESEHGRCGDAHDGVERAD